MHDSFKIKKGGLLFEHDRILISDDYKKQRRLQIISALAWIIYGVLSIFRYINKGDQFLLWSGIVIGGGHLIILLFTLMRTAKDELLYDKIRSFKFKSIFGNECLDIKLKNKRTRRISELSQTEELQKYLRKRFPAMQAS